MALTVSGFTLRNNCTSATNWSSGGTESDTSVDGGGCLKLKVSNTTSSIVTYDFGTTGQDFSGLHMGLYMFIAGTWDTKTNGGVCLYAEDTSGNYYLWYVGGSDTFFKGKAGFELYTIDLDNTNPDESSGTLDNTNIRYLGFRVKTLSKAVKENVFWDELYTFSALTITSGATDQFDLSDIAAWADTNNNSLVVRLTEGVYLTRTGIILGSTTAGLHVDYKSSEEMLVFEQRTVGDGGTAIAATLYQFKIQGNSTGTINFETGYKSGTSGILGLQIQDNTGTCEIDFNDSNIDILKYYGGSIKGVTTITFPNLTGATYECLSTQFVDHDDIIHNGFKIDGGWISVNAKDDAFVFTSNTHLVKNGTIINPTNNGWTTNQSGTISIEGVNFQGTDGVSNYDIENTNASALTVNVVSNSSNIQYENENPGTITINNPITLTLTGLATNTEVTVVRQSDSAVLHHTENVTTGSDSYQYNTGGTLVDVLIFHVDYDIDVSNLMDYTLPSSDTTIPITQVLDLNYYNPT